MNIKFNDHFTYSKLIRFVLPSIGMMIFTSIYSVVDGFFISNFAGETQFSAINLIMPFLMLFSAFGFMIGAGGSALVAKTLGEGHSERANSIFSFLIYFLILVGIVCVVLCQIFIKWIAMLFGASGDLLNYAVLYGRIFSIGFPFFMLQAVFQSFTIAAEKPRLGFIVTVAAGVTNMVLDALLIGVFRLGIPGAACATVISQMVGGAIPFVYFLLPNSSRLRLGKAHFDGYILGKTVSNGLSELLTNISMSVVNMAYNFQLMRFLGEKGVSSFGVIMYVSFIFVAVFLGHSIGVSPVVSFNYGAGNLEELKSLRKKSFLIIFIDSIVMTVLAQVLATPLSRIFVGYDPELLEQTSVALRLYFISFLLCGYNIFASSFFTALNDGIVSAVISFSRVLLFQMAAVFVLPMIFGVNGIWLSITAAEICSLMVSVFCLLKFRKKYGY